MQQQPDQEAGHMDRLTQAANSIDELVQIMYSTLSYLTRKASFKQVNDHMPITQSIPNAEDPEVFAANQRELVSDFLRKAKQLEYLITSLPTSSATTEQEDEAEFEELEKEMQSVNREYEEALKVAEGLHAEIQSSLREALDARTIPPPSS
ncbi:hypothetical protein BCR35DRAFT_352494 [Leucosporidium creatinivorum]|uniref:Mediator of RNA polymerase II transcription subunit 21 n=1 Tax=Leucosporidium creatinivorum TaxID=106004 RepID=A0A1Y2FD05_9BASI|nr:hypothetical protein BCR35DRAFT_352494 [Leucosporidium creatinivorum]